MEKKELSNEENIQNLKKRKILRYILIIMYFLTLVLALADLFLQQTLLLLITVIIFLITMALDKYRESIQIIKHDELEEVKEEIKKTKKKYGIDTKEKTNKEKSKKDSTKKSKTKKK